MSSPIFFIPIFKDHTFVKDRNYMKMIDIFCDYAEIIDDYTTMKKIKSGLGKEYYSKALEWFNNNEDWYRDDLI